MILCKTGTSIDGEVWLTINWGYIMQDWTEDEKMWEALDELVDSSWQPLKELLDLAYEYREQFQPFSIALLFGGMGTFTRVYYECRSQANSSEQAFQEAMLAVQADRRMQAVFQKATNDAVDAQVERMGGE